MSEILTVLYSCFIFYIALVASYIFFFFIR